MSFYGNVTYYLSNAFNKIIYRNAGSASGNNASTDSKASPGIPAYEYGLNPRNRKDETILETGNKWIVFADPDGTVQNNQIKIFHQTVKANTADSVIAPVVRAESSNSEEETEQEATPISLNFGSVLILPTITYDNAGHIVNNGAISYQLPTPQGEEEIEDLDHRIKALAFVLTGSPSFDTTWPDPIPDSYRSYASYIIQNKNNIGNWNLGQNTYQDKQPIGNTLHELLYKMGLATKISNPNYNPYDENNNNEYLYEMVDDTNPNLVYRDGSIMALTTDASSSSRITRDYARRNREAINLLIDIVNEKHESGLSRLPID